MGFKYGGQIENQRERYTQCRSCETGCLRNDKCLPIGTRVVESTIPLYCGIDTQFLEQKAEDESCQNDYECKTNTCSSDRCVDLTKKLEEQQSLLRKILDWLNRLFGGN